jgi:hypothetical protein
MTYYQNTGQDGTDSIVIEPAKLHDEAILLVPELEFLSNYDFQAFNYFSFEADITDMSASEFETWYSSTFEPWLRNLDENYLDIDFDSLYCKFNNQDEKRVFLLKMVNFVMFLLPYQIINKIFKEQDINDIETLKDFLIEPLNLINLREHILDRLDHNMTQFDDFVKTLLHFEKVTKKNLATEDISLLDEHIKKQNLFLEIFKGIINETDMHKFKDLVIAMIENDAKNIL